MFELVLPVLLWYCWEDEEEEGGRGTADTPGKGTVSQGTGGPVRRRLNSHNPLSGSRTEATGRCRSGPSWPPLPLQPRPSTSVLATTSTGSGLLSHPWATYISPSHNPLPLLHCHLSHTGKCLTLFDGCGFPRRQ